MFLELLIAVIYLSLCERPECLISISSETVQKGTSLGSYCKWYYNRRYLHWRNPMFRTTELLCKNFSFIVLAHNNRIVLCSYLGHIIQRSDKLILWRVMRLKISNINCNSIVRCRTSLHIQICGIFSLSSCFNFAQCGCCTDRANGTCLFLLYFDISLEHVRPVETECADPVVRNTCANISAAAFFFLLLLNFQ